MGGCGGGIDLEVFNPCSKVPIFAELWNCDVVFSYPFRRIYGSLFLTELASGRLDIFYITYSLFLSFGVSRFAFSLRSELGLK